MLNELHIFLPVRRVIIVYSIVFGLLVIVSVVIALKYGGIFFWLMMPLTISAFIFVFVPVLKNPRLILRGNEVRLSIFGKWHTINFTNDLIEIVVKGNEVQSYRFKSHETYYQISPLSYYEADEVDKLLSKLLKKHKGSFSVINR